MIEQIQIHTDIIFNGEITTDLTIVKVIQLSQIEKLQVVVKLHYQIGKIMYEIMHLLIIAVNG